MKSRGIGIKSGMDSPTVVMSGLVFVKNVQTSKQKFLENALILTIYYHIKGYALVFQVILIGPLIHEFKGS